MRSIAHRLVHRVIVQRPVTRQLRRCSSIFRIAVVVAPAIIYKSFLPHEKLCRNRVRATNQILILTSISLIERLVMMQRDASLEAGTADGLRRLMESVVRQQEKERRRGCVGQCARLLVSTLPLVRRQGSMSSSRKISRRLSNLCCKGMAQSTDQVKELPNFLRFACRTSYDRRDHDRLVKRGRHTIDPGTHS